MHRSLLAAALAAGTCAAAEPVTHHRAPFTVVSDTQIIVADTTYTSWDDLAASGYFQNEHTRCGVKADLHDIDAALRAPSDCSSFNTTVRPAYDPSVERYRIPVVVHVIQNTSGTGFIPLARVQSQIDILNEDFLALPGSLGAPGTDAQIEFYLATEDPNGNPTTGVTYTTNNSWFNDNGTYYNSLAWDPDRYLNIYTNSASGALGYVPFLPSTAPGSVGSNADRVVVLYSSFGRNAPLTPFHLGRTATHEVGHYLGLFHTFDGGCGTVSNCSGTGDLICDTNRESSPTYGCPSSRSTCSGTPAPKENYMDYSDDACMNRFTPDQANRMRCTLLNYRQDVYDIVSAACNPADLNADGALTVDDLDLFIAAFFSSDLAADCTADGVLTVDDLDCFIAAFQAGCP